MSENQFYSELNMLYVRVASMNGYIAEFQRQVDEILQKIDSLQHKIDTARIIDAELALTEKNTDLEHLGNNGDVCVGCNDSQCEAAKIDPSDYIEAK